MSNALGERLQQQLSFVIELDRLKTVLRQTLLTDSSRRENSAEHSWHLALMALTLAEYAPEGADLAGAIKQLLIHDIVEIDAGDVFCYDDNGQVGQAERERLAAERIFGLLPPDQGQALMVLWKEFESQTTPTARFAAALDRIQPLIHNQQTEGGTWRQYGIRRAQVMQRMQPVKIGVPALWPYVLQVIEDSIALGYLLP